MRFAATPTLSTSIRPRKRSRRTRRNIGSPANEARTMGQENRTASPIAALIPKALSNVLVARPIDLLPANRAGQREGDAGVLAMGEAAGLAAATPQRHSGQVRDVDAGQLRSRLRNWGRTSRRNRIKTTTPKKIAGRHCECCDGLPCSPQNRSNIATAFVKHKRFFKFFGRICLLFPL